jgi:benzoate/toluate 1,2-dioxygenase alpha subunit/2,4,5-trichlorophenoxyacetic acid oxygenase 1
MLASAPSPTVDLDALLVDDPARGAFQVRKDVFTDPGVFDLELTRIFEGTWVFVGLTSQAPKPNDFFTFTIGRQPVIVIRGADNTFRCFYNSCRHRGALLCPLARGNAASQICRYHGWSYDTTGKNIGITGQRDGCYPESFAEANTDLIPVARFDEYRGFLFASLNPDVPSLDEHLGGARRFLDTIADQGPDGIAFVPGEVRYTVDANWKVSVENVLDSYHFASTHRSYSQIIEERKNNGRATATKLLEDEPLHRGTFLFDRGHSVLWRNRNSGTGTRPLLLEPGRLEATRARIGELRTKWILMSRSILIYPNLQIVDISSIQFRVIQPLDPGRTEITSYCAVPIGESSTALRTRIREYQDFFNPSGFASADDNVMFERSQVGYAANPSDELFGYLRGMAADHSIASAYAAEVGVPAERAVEGPLGMGDESAIVSSYREWYRLLRAG